MAQKRTKRVNGTGSIVRDRNRKYRIRVMAYKDGVLKRITLKSGIRNYNEAKRILDEYNLKPYDLDINVLTFKELHEQFMKYKKEDNTTEKTLRNYNFAFKRCKALHNDKVKDIMKPKIELFLKTLKQKNGTEASKGTKNNTKIFLNMLFGFAVDNRLIKDNPANFRMRSNNFEKKNKKNPFTTAEIQKLWDNVDNYEFIDVILIMIYTGVRFDEMRMMKIKNIDLINNVIKNSGNKTAKGKDRLIIIKKEIKDLIIRRCEESPTEYLVYGSYMTDSKKQYQEVGKTYFRNQFNKIMEAFGMEHTPHDTRRTLATKLYKSGMKNKDIIDIMGHTEITTTENYYVCNDEEELKEAMDKVDLLN